MSGYSAPDRLCKLNPGHKFFIIVIQPRLCLLNHNSRLFGFLQPRSVISLLQSESAQHSSAVYESDYPVPVSITYEGNVNIVIANGCFPGLTDNLHVQTQRPFGEFWIP